MKTVWDNADGKRMEMTAPLSLIVSAFAPVSDARRSLTPMLSSEHGHSTLILIDLGRGQNRLGASALAQVYKQVGDKCPDLDEPQLLKGLFYAIQALNREGLLLAYHDRSDGGLLVTLAEMAFAGRCGLHVILDDIGCYDISCLFSEELGAVIQVADENLDTVMGILKSLGMGHFTHIVGRPLYDDEQILFTRGNDIIMQTSRSELHKAWSETSWHMQSLRDNPECADEEYARIDNTEDPGLSPYIAFDPDADITSFFINTGAKPKMAILREQGVNGQVEMAAAFDKAGFASVDVHMSDIIEGRVALEDFRGLVACGGFSYGDVLGAGGGWAKSILFHNRARDQFEAFFRRDDTFALGVCNGCQMLSGLKELIPGAEHWPRFVRNRSEQFEARLSLVEIMESDSILLRGMAGSRIPIAVAHGEGQAEFANADAIKSAHVALRYIENDGSVAERYPANPNGSPAGITGLTTTDGRVTIMMPHPERVFRTVQFSWAPENWGEPSPWMRLFRNARAWVA